MENEKRCAKKQEAHFEHLEKNEQQRENRELFLKAFSTLSLLDKLKLLIKECKPLHYYPTDIANVPSEIIKALTFEERKRLFNMIKKSRIKEWNETEERIRQVDAK